MASKELPEDFKIMIQDQLGTESSDLLEALMEEPVVSVRKNLRKPVECFEGAEPVKWCKSGLYLPERPVFTLDPLFHAGAYYVQEASSMIYETVAACLSSEFMKESDNPSLSVLDMCAAPGGKTTAIINGLPDGSFIHANEFVAKRTAVLKENLIKWGYPYHVVTNKDTSLFRNLPDKFDIVAVDAPCSGEGMMRKEPAAVNQWNFELVKQCASLQRQILQNSCDALKPGGFLIYSTCTFNRVENEGNAEFIKNSLDLEPFDISLPYEWGISAGIDTDLPVYRFMPHKTKGEGLFLAVFRKPGEWEANKKKPLKLQNFSDKISEEPDIQNILSVNYNQTDFPSAELSKEEALKYLRRESIRLPEEIVKGYVVVTYKGLPLGPVKNIGSRANNLYPKNWRIRTL